MKEKRAEALEEFDIFCEEELTEKEQDSRLVTKFDKLYTEYVESVFYFGKKKRYLLDTYARMYVYLSLGQSERRKKLDDIQARLFNKRDSLFVCQRIIGYLREALFALS